MYTSGGRTSLGSGASQARGVAKPVSTIELHALVIKMTTRIGELEKRLATQEESMLAQQRKTEVLERENSDLWNELRRLKGLRLPAEICYAIVESAVADKPTLKTFSLVCKNWMQLTRKTLFSRIRFSAMFWYVKIKPEPILASPHCTIFPYVQKIEFNGSMEDGSEHNRSPSPTWMDGFLVHMHKFSGLHSLCLYHLDPWNFDLIVKAMPMINRQTIQFLRIDHFMNPELHEFTDFISNFPALATLVCGDIREWWSEDAVAWLVETDKPLIPPPQSIKQLYFDFQGSRTGSHLPVKVLKWFTRSHSGRIESLSPCSLATLHPTEFKEYLNCQTDEFVKSQYFIGLKNLRSVEIFPLTLVSNTLQMLAQLPPSIEQITLKISHSDFNAAAMRQYDGFLAGPRLGSLSRVILSVWRFCLDDEALFQEKCFYSLPQCTRKPGLNLSMHYY
ncbi:hypothetical protein R3P38DRAFT_2838286 [Favolaschia claudopus]|uniref:F-box domain-containing protein n=1 Tax=Favolaschia claudopus TaxID=2862362 RepID=A0AAW0E4L7_9AGAR